MSLLSPAGSWSRQRRRRARIRRAVLVVAVLALAGAAYFGVLRYRGGSGAVTACPTPAASPVALPAAAEVTVRVLNAGTRAGLAHQIAQELQGRGFRLGAVGNAPPGTPVPPTAVVRHGAAGLGPARLVAAQVSDAPLVADGRADASVDLVIGNGFARLHTPAEAAAAATPPPAPAATPTGRCR